MFENQGHCSTPGRSSDMKRCFKFYPQLFSYCPNSKCITNYSPIIQVFHEKIYLLLKIKILLDCLSHMFEFSWECDIDHGIKALGSQSLKWTITFVFY